MEEPTTAAEKDAIRESEDIEGLVSDPAAEQIAAVEQAVQDAGEQLPEQLEEITDEQALALQAAEALQFVRNTPTLNAMLNGAGLSIHRDPETGDRRVIIGPVFLNIHLPMDEDMARAVSRELSGGIEIASQADVKRVIEQSGGLKVVR
jgi:hypothetical protein